MNELFQNTQTFGRGDTLPTPPLPQNVAKCGFWCKGFKILKGVVTAIAPPLGAVLYVADEAFNISDSLEAIDDKNAAQRGGTEYLQPSQQVRQGKLNLM
jgi:hypothetical protein